MIRIFACNALVVSLCLAPQLVHGQAAAGDASAIDAALIAGIDLRMTAYEPCLGQQSCTVDGLTVAALRVDTAGVWQPANLYWDPVDGFGVQGGGQNDEIDFDERIVVTFDQPKSLGGVWLSDLFIGEGRHYGGASAATQQDAELATMQIAAPGASPVEIALSGDRLLPDVTFNSRIFGGIEEDGDLLSRLIVEDDTVRIFAAGVRNGSPLVAKGGAIDADKAGIFEGVETIQRDDAELFAMINGAILFPSGSYNAKVLSDLASDSSYFGTMYKRALLERSFGDETNGEVATSFGAPRQVNSIAFSAPVGTSNDYSVAGFVVN